MSPRKRYWMMKSEPDAFSIDDLARVDARVHADVAESSGCAAMGGEDVDVATLSERGETVQDRRRLETHRRAGAGEFEGMDAEGVPLPWCEP